MSDSTKVALTFIRRISSDIELRKAVEEMGSNASLNELIALAEKYGYTIDETSLKNAYRANWIMHWHLYSR